MGRQKTRSENEQDGRKIFFNTVLFDTVKKTAEEGLRTILNVGIYVFGCENELQAGDEQLALYVGSPEVFRNMSDEPRCKFYNHRLPSNANYNHVVITLPDNIQ